MRNITKYILLIIGITISIPAKSETISYAGDSISYGLGMTSRHNGGIVGSGLTVGNPEKNYNHWKEYTENTDKTIIEIGTNDFSYNGKLYEIFLSKYILPLNSKNKICMVSIPIPVNRNDVKKGVIRLNLLESKWANDNNIKYIKFPNFNISEKTKDGIHFTPSGYNRLSKIILEKCKGIQ